ncbi:glypican-6 isoform X2 [Cephus cinctus]|uniref:Glypican-6 isoform X2 n=1 Tax=Cephus cinctus TaxID=211228 RepID=A0AAJ7W2B8_CEPCN|nr:glypican-6 isoform X2 [Cephus cinctus]
MKRNSVTRIDVAWRLGVWVSCRVSEGSRCLQRRMIPGIENFIKAMELKTCGGVRSGREVCCSADMETRLQARARDKHEKALKETLQRLQQLLATRDTRFQNFFKELLATSKKGFHEMFKKTYGILYEQNSEVFTDLFIELENYYAKGTVDLDEVMENFFNTLYQKMFTVLNSQYQFDRQYLECVSNHMKEMAPFGDVPHKLGVQVKRCFVATRAFSQALSIAADVLKNMQTLESSPECAAALTRMTVCPSCSGIPGNVLACGDMCANVMKGCLAQHAALDSEWNQFIKAFDKIADRLLGPFNIEMLVRPINLKISEAIMNFQENSQEVSKGVFSACGRPVLGRRRRRNNQELELESLKFDQEPSAEDKTPTAVMLDKLVKEIRQKVRDSRQFWVYLPYQLCNNGLVVPPSNTKECWNGTHVDKYIYPVSSDGESQNLNPEVRASTFRPTIVREQIFALATITNRLRSAYSGQDVDWIDTEETWYGSGSGSGDDEDDDRITDDEDGFAEKGSGYEPQPVPEKPYVPPEEIEPPKVNTEHKVTSNTTRTTDSGASRQKMSLSRALTTYLFPIVVMWFGGCFTEWL